MLCFRTFLLFFFYIYYNFSFVFIKGGYNSRFTAIFSIHIL